MTKLKKVLMLSFSVAVLLFLFGFIAKIWFLETPPNFGTDSSEAIAQTGFKAFEAKIPLTFTGFNKVDVFRPPGKPSMIHLL